MTAAVAAVATSTKITKTEPKDLQRFPIVIKLEIFLFQEFWIKKTFRIFYFILRQVEKLFWMPIEVEIGSIATKKKILAGANVSRNLSLVERKSQQQK